MYLEVESGSRDDSRIACTGEWGVGSGEWGAEEGELDTVSANKRYPNHLKKNREGKLAKRERLQQRFLQESFYKFLQKVR
jgi:hypothetical protein